MGTGILTHCEVQTRPIYSHREVNAIVCWRKTGMAWVKKNSYNSEKKLPRSIVQSCIICTFMYYIFIESIWANRKRKINLIIHIKYQHFCLSLLPFLTVWHILLAIFFVTFFLYNFDRFRSMRTFCGNILSFWKHLKCPTVQLRLIFDCQKQTISLLRVPNNFLIMFPKVV